MTEGGGGLEILKFCVTSFMNAPRGKIKTWFKGFLCAVQILVMIIYEFDMVIGPSAESKMPKLNFTIELKEVIIISYCQKPNKPNTLFLDQVSFCK